MSGEHRITDHRWEGFTDDDLAEVIDTLNAGAGPAAIAGAVDALRTVAGGLYEIDATLHDKLDTLGVEWQAPQSSELARSAVAASKRYASHSGDAVTATIDALSRQADAYARARDSAPPSAALRGSGRELSLFSLVGSGAGALTAHGRQDAAAAHQRHREARARAIDALRGYNDHTNDTLGAHQPLPGEVPGSVPTDPVPAYTATGPTAPPSPGGDQAPGPGAPQVASMGTSGAAPAGGPTAVPYPTGGTVPAPPAGPAVATPSTGAAPAGACLLGAVGAAGAPAEQAPVAGSPRGASGRGAAPGSVPGGGAAAGTRPGGVPPERGASVAGPAQGRAPAEGLAARGRAAPAPGAPHPGAPGPLAEGGRAGVGPATGSPAPGGTASAGADRRRPSTGTAAGSAVLAGAAGAGMAGGAAQPDRLVRGRGAPAGAGPSLDEELAEPECPDPEHLSARAPDTTADVPEED